MKKRMCFKKGLLKTKASLIILTIVLAFFASWPGGMVKAEESMSILAPLKATLGGLAAAPTGLMVSDAGAKTQTWLGRTIDDIGKFLSEGLLKAGKKALTVTVRNTLNRMAYDAANLIATSGEGQKPLWITEDLGTYFENIGDAAAGDFIDSLGQTWQMDLCKPSDPNITARIGLGLVQQQRPLEPNCTLSELSTNYASAYEKYAAMKDGDYLKSINQAFSPGGSEISTAFTLFGRTFEQKIVAEDNALVNANINQGWIEKTNIAGKVLQPRGSSKDDFENAAQSKWDAMLYTTGDALVDAANIFLNQLAYEGFQRGLRELAKGKATSAPYDYKDGATWLIDYGVATVSEKLTSVIKPRFNIKSDYSVLAELSACPDWTKQGPNNCVIDDSFAQAISEKLTVAEALDKGYLHGDWLISDNSNLQNTYTLRSFSILRKFRVIPVGWEQAILVAARNNYKATLMDLMVCFESDDIKYTQFSNNFDKNNQSWCEGLVDPNWVLKLPLNSCRKQGAGGQILSTLPSIDQNGFSILNVARSTDYCADEQTCVKEKNDGSCEVYGYCNEEKRTWDFNADSCEPIYNTCQTFTNSSNNQSVSYLENTLDYGTCDSSNAGCKQYVYGGSYLDGSVAWDKKFSIYFNSKVEACKSTDEGCTTLLRGKPGWNNVNYVMNSSFAADAVGDNMASSTLKWPVTATKAEIRDFDGAKALYVEGSGRADVLSNNSNSLLPTGLSPVPGWSYSLSAEVFLEEGTSADLYFTEDNLTNKGTVQKSWQTLTVTGANQNQTVNELSFSIVGSGASVKMYVRNIQLTPNSSIANYVSYGNNPVYQKIIPPYLENACYTRVGTGLNDYRLKAGAPAACYAYARKCNSEEVGCNSFQSAKDGFVIAAKAATADFCPAVCNNYDTYVARESYFFDTSSDNLIPESTRTCSAQSVGCASFTNLDEVSQGGEKQENYTYIRQCIKPDTTKCGDFYSWEGNSELRALSLQKDDLGNPKLVNNSLAASCTKEIYYLPTTDPKYNPDCREFYSKSGLITYRLLSNTYSCSDNCHPYRLNEKNIDKLATAATCVGEDKYWDANVSDCFVCKNGGIWDTRYNACLYNAIPNEGITCAASELGCREYNGNGGENLKRVASYNFEAGTDPFIAQTGTVTQSLDSTAKEGHSLSYSGGTLEVDAQAMLKKGSSYVMKFMAKSASQLTFNASAENSDAVIATFNVNEANPSGDLMIKGGSSWQLYEINLAAINHDIKNEKLKLKISGAILIDNLVINEISDRYYLIKGSSQIPDDCYYDNFDKYQGPNYNLGCSMYTDRSNDVQYLHRFSNLCQDSAVGCEQMIETNNSTNPLARTINLNNDDRTAPCTAGAPGCISVSSHKVTYAVYDPTKACFKDDAGCSRFAYSQSTASATTWVDSYKKNLPDKYDTILCQGSEVGCEEWSYGNNNAKSYFKNPGSDVCVYRSGAWFKATMKRCDTNGDNKILDNERNGAVCNADVDCGVRKCIIDTNDYSCDTTYFKTFGLGGTGGAIPTPSKNAALCESASAGCSEFIDPVSGYMANVIVSTEDVRYKIKPNSLYILTGSSILDKFGTSDADTKGVVRILGADNNLATATPRIVGSATSSIIFHSGLNSMVSVSNISSSAVTLKESIINYKLNTELDLRTCGGVINTENGCVLFNSRYRSAGALKFDAAGTMEGAAAKSCSGTNCSANQVVKVRPDRICSNWLACSSYSQDPITKERICYDVDECDKLNEKNECGNFVTKKEDEVRRIDIGTNEIATNINTLLNRNVTGYALLNKYYLGAMKEVGQNTTIHYNFENPNTNLSCRTAATKGVCTFDKDIIRDSLVLEPDASPSKIDYPAMGRGFLKVLNYYQISPNGAGTFDNLIGGQDYYINYLVNTKHASAKAQVLIFDSTNLNNPIHTFVDSADGGWERKIHKFPIPNNVQIKIYLTSNTTDVTSDGYVYFDDINIEPVLEVAKDTYVSKECRLYPGADSLSCLSLNNNVVKDGLYGYCLERDPLDKNICLMWYPIDKISPTTRNNDTILGYQGKFPLFYCTEVNGNFQVMKKIVARRVEKFIDKKAKGDDKDGLVDMDEDGCGGYKPSACSAICGDCTNYELFVTNDHINWNHENYYCLPRRTVGVLKVEKVINTFPGEGSGCAESYIDSSWVPFNGNFVDRAQGTCERGECTGIDEEQNVTPPIAVYDFNNPPANESELKLTYSVDPEKVYRVNCNKFAQLVDPEGGNIAWTGRVGRGSTFTDDTPTFFNSALSGKIITKYGRNREDVPFGSAILPSDYTMIGAPTLQLRNQYSKQMGETVFAGRPYGCSTISGSPLPGCYNIGQCSLNSNISCILTPLPSGNIPNDAIDLNKQACAAAGGGSCVSMWSSPMINNDAQSVLSTIFLKNYANFSLLGGEYKLDNSSWSIQIPGGYNPEVGNLKFYSIDADGRELPVALGSVAKSGMYKLTFTTKVNLEHQPLKQITINWGDGKTQTVTGEDNKTSVDSPHELYHYFLTGNYNFTIKAIDNWGKSN